MFSKLWLNIKKNHYISKYYNNPDLELLELRIKKNNIFAIFGYTKSAKNQQNQYFKNLTPN